MGESVTDGSVTSWRKKPGDFVTAGEPLVEVTTDKVDVEIPATATGKLTRILAEEGKTISVGAPLAEIDTSASPGSVAAAVPMQAAQSSSPAVPTAKSPTASRTTPTDGAAQPPISTVLMPALGESVTEGTVAQWRKSEGERVTSGDVLVEVTTDKVNVEIPAPQAGSLRRILVRENETVKVGQALCELAVATTVADEAPAALPVLRPAEQGEVAFPDPVSYAAPPPLKLRRAVLRSEAADLGGEPAAIRAHPPVESVPPGAKATPLRGPAAALVKHMEQSLTIPTATSFRTVQVDVLEAQRRALNEALKSANRKEKISFTHIIAFAIVRASAAVPAMHASFRRNEDVPERVDRGMHLGLAVDVRKPDGTRMLVVPVVHAADQLGFAFFHKTYEEMVEKARAGSLAPADLSGATLTLTNPGGIGTSASVPRLMAGQGAIIAAGAIGLPPGFSAAPEPTLRASGVAKIMTLTSTYDHRIIQGAESGEFLRRVDHLLNGADGFYEALFADLRLTPPPVSTAPASRHARTAAGQPAAATGTDPDIARAGAAAMALVMRYRHHGVNVADLDPLSDEHPSDPALDPGTLGLDPALMAKLPASALRVYAPGNTLADVITKLRDTYSSTIAYDVEHISNHEQRSWLRQQIESGAHRRPLSPERKRELLERLTRVESFERYLRKAFLGQKTFSIEGLDNIVPMLEEMLIMLADEGVREVHMGMAHRGRLAVITHVVDRPYEEVLAEFEQAQVRGLVHRHGDVTGDVKYHQGASGTYEAPDKTNIRVVLAHNPSHLEAVDSVVEGQTRAVQTDRTANMPKLDFARAAPILIHGDAAFGAQGTVAEVFNFQSLPGYTTGGTLHIIANNQIGFTTLPPQGRSTHYASDLAKGFDVPIIHVNADDLEACIAAVHLAVDYRRKFHRDALIDVIGYRRFGHNEADEPAYTQPLMYEKIAKHPTARDIFARKLVDEGTISEKELADNLQRAQQRVADAHAAAKARVSAGAAIESSSSPKESVNGAVVETRVPAAVLTRLNAELLQVPDNFAIHPKLQRQLERRKEALGPKGEIDFGLAEALAFATLLRDGAPLRLTGQDTERGTFSHRHLVLHDVKNERAWIPMQHLPDAKASFEIYNSPLSEYACMGFEYGYSATAPEALVMWEAQFGDFSNGGQVIIDQFIAAGRAKWEETSRLTLLLPHGYEGAGPEHSSARLERFLQLAAEGNFRVANCTTPAQYFHLLRDQAKSVRARPLVIMTPKSLLRLKAASSQLADLTERGFAPVIDDPHIKDRSAVTRLILCSGRIYYDLDDHPQRALTPQLAIARVELLEPFPFEEVLSLIGSYPNVRTVTWVQEEPKNMGARAFVSRRIRERLIPKGIAFDYIGRPDRAAPSEGYAGAHAAEQERIVSEALGVTAAKPQ